MVRVTNTTTNLSGVDRDEAVRRLKLSLPLITLNDSLPSDKDSLDVVDKTLGTTKKA
jgi:hypothetical protein